ncbi:MAG TPA: glycosyltransferase family 39 protein [Acidobacteriaceae bacterium]|nr:glycosyltransferase family 39 protein [Acidobacteriaceae bacterium]
MTSIASPEFATHSSTAFKFRKSHALWLLSALWALLFVASLFSPPVLDDADGTHANAARQMLLSGDWVTLRVNNVRYLEKAPLPYWLAAASFRLFGFNSFAAHLPGAISVLLLTLLGFSWAAKAFGDRAALYTGFGILTSAGVFLFTRVFIPDVLLSLLLAIALYCFLQSISDGVRYSAGMPYAMWAALALAVLTKGLVAIVFLLGTVLLFGAVTGGLGRWRLLKPFSGALVFLLIAAPWHILAGLRNTGGMNGHGFFWFYFINEHVLRFLGQRIPRDYNKLPGYLYWSLHLVWLFPWSLFAPLVLIDGWRRWTSRREALTNPGELRFNLATNSRLLLAICAGFVLLFFSFSTNQEYYTFPAYLPLLMLIAASLASAEAGRSDHSNEASSARRWITLAHAAYTLVGALIAAALAYGLWTSRHLAAARDVGELLAHRGVGDYTLSMSSLFDLTGPSFAALRLPAVLALGAFAFGPGIAWILRTRRRDLAATTTIALTSAVFLIAAHLALARFSPMLSSQDMAATIQQREASGAISRNNTFLLYGDQAYGSSIPFYLNRPLNHPALLVDGRSSSMLFGSTFPDAQSLFLSPTDLLAQWGSGPRKLLFVPLEHRNDADRLLGSRAILLKETAGKVLITDRPLDR